jgi:glycogen synthase
VIYADLSQLISEEAMRKFDKKGWDILRRRGMNCNNSWGASAGAYIGLYKELVGKK